MASEALVVLRGLLKGGKEGIRLAASLGVLRLGKEYNRDSQYLKEFAEQIFQNAEHLKELEEQLRREGFLKDKTRSQRNGAHG